MIERLLRRTAGEVRVCVTGASLPRFLNACTQGGVRLRRMERVSWDRMDATLSLGDFRKLRSCMGRTGCRVHILERRGARACRGRGGDGGCADRQSRAADEGERSPSHGSGGGDGRGIYRASGAVGAAVEKGKKILLQENVSTYVD